MNEKRKMKKEMQMHNAKNQDQKDADVQTSIVKHNAKKMIKEKKVMMR